MSQRFSRAIKCQTITIPTKNNEDTVNSARSRWLKFSLNIEDLQDRIEQGSRLEKDQKRRRKIAKPTLERRGWCFYSNCMCAKARVTPESRAGGAPVLGGCAPQRVPARHNVCDSRWQAAGCGPQFRLFAAMPLFNHVTLREVRSGHMQSKGQKRGRVPWGETACHAETLRGSTWVSEAEGEGNCGQVPLPWFLQESKGDAE